MYDYQTIDAIVAQIEGEDITKAKITARLTSLCKNGIAEKTDYPYMTLRHCPIKSHVGGDCANCKYDKNFAYVMENGKVLNLKRKKLTTCTFYLTD